MDERAEAHFGCAGLVASVAVMSRSGVSCARTANSGGGERSAFNLPNRTGNACDLTRLAPAENSSCRRLDASANS